MKNRSFVCKGVAAVVLSLSAVSANAEIGNGEYAIGFQSGLASYGLVGRVGITDEISAEAVLGFFGVLSHYGVRGLYTLKDEDYWNAYAFGTAGFLTWDGLFKDESSVVFGGGVGIEYDWQAFNEDLPPISWNLELGLGVAPGFDDYSFSAFGIGAGLRYKF